MRSGRKHAQDRLRKATCSYLSTQQPPRNLRLHSGRHVAVRSLRRTSKLAKREEAPTVRDPASSPSGLLQQTCKRLGRAGARATRVGGAERAVTRVHAPGRAARRPGGMTGRGHCKAREFRGDRCVHCLKSSGFPGDRPGDHRGDCCKTRDFCGQESRCFSISPHNGLHETHGLYSGRGPSCRRAAVLRGRRHVPA